MIIRNYASGSGEIYLTLRIIAHCRQSTAHLIDSQTLLPLVSGLMADNHAK